ncbi:MAG TPA: ABC transporter substrate-binding protein [Acetobacteraceae bacterium]|nr:ABC transporter substrate-binding protein [Acetobacteraceae bacterium]
MLQARTKRNAPLGALLAIGLLALSAAPAWAKSVVFLSTQLRPLEEAQLLRSVILKGFTPGATVVPEVPPQLPIHMQADAKSGTHTISAVGALHGELEPLAGMGLLRPLDTLAASLKGRGIPAKLMRLGRLGTAHQMYIPWMQATYIMVANRKALPYLPPGAKLDSLSYAQFAQWAANIKAKTGRRALGFPAGPKGLMARFFEGYLYPSFTGGVVTPFRSPQAAQMWAYFAKLWKDVDPNSTNYGFMQEPLLAGSVWIAFDHVARVIDALKQHPHQFIAFPPPAGPKGRGYMPVIVGLAIAKDAPDPAGAAGLITWLTRPSVQIRTAQSVGFFPVVKAKLPADLPAGIRLEADAIAKTQAAPDALPTLLPVGLGNKDGDFNKVYMDTFQLIVLRHRKIMPVLDAEAKKLRRLMAQTKAPCWAPDAPSQGACPVN